MRKSGFTMIELVFVIVVLGILSSIAIPRLAVNRDDAVQARIKADIASIQTGISLHKSKAMMEGNLTNWKKEFQLGDGFEKVLDKKVKINSKCSETKSGWCLENKKYRAKMNKKNYADFDLNRTSWIFECVSNNKDDCKLFE